MLGTVRYLIGSAGPGGFGSKSTAEEVTELCPDLRSITAIITGGTSGIGAETARVLAKRGARLILPARSMKTAEETKCRILLESPDAEILAMALDLSSLASVRSFVAEFESLNLPLNLLMSFPANEATAEEDDGNGETDGRSRQNRERVVRQYDATRAYALSKLANVLHTKELAQRLKMTGANLTANCVHPGIVRTRLTREREGLITDLVFFLTSKLLKTIPQAAATTCYVATDPRLENVSGKYFADCNEASSSKMGSNLTEAARMWVASDKLVSTDSNEPVLDPFHGLD
nr:short-chain dehydrogenase TIC 32, chloroplastic-like [Ipomoea batatas]